MTRFVVFLIPMRALRKYITIFQRLYNSHNIFHNSMGRKGQRTKGKQPTRRGRGRAASFCGGCDRRRCRRQSGGGYSAALLFYSSRGGNGAEEVARTCAESRDCFPGQPRPSLFQDVNVAGGCVPHPPRDCLAEKSITLLLPL